MYGDRMRCGRCRKYRDRCICVESKQSLPVGPLYKRVRQLHAVRIDGVKFDPKDVHEAGEAILTFEPGYPQINVGPEFVRTWHPRAGSYYCLDHNHVVSVATALEFKTQFTVVDFSQLQEVS